MNKYTQLCYYYLLLVLLSNRTNYFICATHITGNFNSNDFFKFVVKFGFQKTEIHSQKESFGYIYGNLTSQYTFDVPLTFAVLDKNNFLSYYENRKLVDKELACQKMFENLNYSSFDLNCNPKGNGDYLRRIPCEKGKLCVDEDSPEKVVQDSQFTYILSDLKTARFWYVSLVACYRNKTTCKWHHYDHNKFKKTQTELAPIIQYDFQLVNGNPKIPFNFLVFHFSFDKQNTLEMYFIFFVIYLVLVPMQFYAVRIQKHPVTKLFTISLFIEFISLCFILVHMINFAMNGVGNTTLETIGNILDIFSRTSFMLILLLLAKGWAVTRQQISRIDWISLMIIWIPYCGFNVFLYGWNSNEVDIISDVDEYQTWPGWLVLACRSAFMLWFLWELRNTMKYEHSTKKLDFLLHFGASSLVWFIYLPVVAVVALQVSPLWRYKLLLGITNSADCLAYCVMTGLLWPNRSGQYLLLAGPNFPGMDELDEFNEAPHIVHGDTILPHEHHSDAINSNDLIHSDDHLLINNRDASSTKDIFNGGSNSLVLHDHLDFVDFDDTDEEEEDLFHHNLLNLNGEAIDLNKKSNVIA